MHILTVIYYRKAKSETLNEVMNDLSFLIHANNIKQEGDDSTSEKVQIPKKITKKENIENTGVRKLDPADVKIIDRLDLNVKKFKTNLPAIKRRHSIERFPITTVDSSNDGLMTQFVFNQVPR